MADALKLEQVGAIHRVKRGRVKIIAVTPEGAFRGTVHNHAKAVEKFKLDVIEGGKDSTSMNAPLRNSRAGESMYAIAFDSKSRSSKLNMATLTTTPISRSERNLPT